MYPQEVIITFRSLVAMDTITVKSVNCMPKNLSLSSSFLSSFASQVRRLRVERSELAEPSDFEALTEKGTCATQITFLTLFMYINKLPCKLSFVKEPRYLLSMQCTCNMNVRMPNRACVNRSIRLVTQQK